MELFREVSSDPQTGIIGMPNIKMRHYGGKGHNEPQRLRHPSQYADIA